MISAWGGVGDVAAGGDLSRFTFIDVLTPRQLSGLLSLAKGHVYLSTPGITGWSLFNAMSCGTPVVASNTGAIPEMIEHGKNGMLTPFTDWKIVAEDIIDILRMPSSDWKEMSKKARDTIVENYSFDVTVPRLMSWFEKIVAG